MTKRFVLIVALIAVSAALGGALVASNMGFKFNYRLEGPGAASNTGTNTLGLPYFRDEGLDSASALIDSIGLANVGNVQRFLESNDGLQTYTGRKGSGPDFALSSGEGYYIRMTSPVNYIIVGSHDPTQAIRFEAPDGGATSNTGTSFYAYPYHSTAATASELINDIGGTAVVANVQRFLEDTDGLQIYTGRKGSGPDFDLLPGEAYFVRVSSTVDYVPSHY